MPNQQTYNHLKQKVTVFLNCIRMFVAFVTITTFIVTLFFAVFNLIYGNYDFSTEGVHAAGASYFGNVVVLYFEPLIFLFCLIWFLTFFITVIPYTLGMFFIIRMGAFGFKTFVFGGVLLGMIMSPIFAVIPADVPMDPVDFAAHQFVVLTPVLIIACGVAAAVCRLMLKIITTSRR